MKFGLINLIGVPYWYINLSPADTKHPICIYYANTREEYKPGAIIVVHMIQFLQFSFQFGVITRLYGITTSE